MREIREGKGLKQKQLATLTGLSQVYISRIERGDIDGLTIRNLVKISHALQISPIKLLNILLKIKEGKE